MAHCAWRALSALVLLAPAFTAAIAMGGVFCARNSTV